MCYNYYDIDENTYNFQQQDFYGVTFLTLKLMYRHSEGPERGTVSHTPTRSTPPRLKQVVAILQIDQRVATGRRENTVFFSILTGSLGSAHTFAVFRVTVVPEFRRCYGVREFRRSGNFVGAGTSPERELRRSGNFAGAGISPERESRACSLLSPLLALLFTT